MPVAVLHRCLVAVQATGTSRHRLRGGSYQVRVYDGRDPETGKQVILTGSAQDEPGAIRLRNRFRADIAGNKSPRTTGTVGALLTRGWTNIRPTHRPLKITAFSLSHSSFPHWERFGSRD